MAVPPEACFMLCIASKIAAGGAAVLLLGDPCSSSSAIAIYHLDLWTLNPRTIISAFLRFLQVPSYPYLGSITIITVIIS